MRKNWAWVLTGFMGLGLYAFAPTCLAGFYVTNAPATLSTSPKVQDLKTGYPQPGYNPNSNNVYTATLVRGSLKNNLTRVAAEQGWGQVVWGLSYDYTWPKQQTISASTLQGVLNKILLPYPLKAVIYQRDNVIVIKPRS